MQGMRLKMPNQEPTHNTTSNPDEKITPSKTILFEYPLQEKLRGYLRLEALFKQFHRNLALQNTDSHTYALKTLFEILDILSRGDTRAELIKELTKLLHYFQKLAANPDVDTSKLSNFLQQIEQLHYWVNNYKGKFGESIRKHPFITAVKHRTSIPGGSCSFDCPELYLFLNRPYEVRKAELVHWLNDIKGIQTSIEVILRLIRDSGQWRSEKAPMGSFMLETSEQQLRLMRIKNIDGEQIFPEFSCGKHRSSIHFMVFNQQHKKIPLNAAVKFELACCH